MARRLLVLVFALSTLPGSRLRANTKTNRRRNIVTSRQGTFGRSC